MSSFVSFLPLAFHPPYLHFTLIVTLILLFTVWIFFNRFRFFYDQWKRKRNPPAPFQPQLLQYYKSATILWAVFVFFSSLLLAAAFYLTNYQLLIDRVEPAGHAISRGRSVEFIGTRGERLIANPKGSQLAAAGVFLRFPQWMSVLGLHTYHRLITFRGNKETEFHYGKKPDASWLSPHVDAIYKFLYDNKEWAPLDTYYVESVYFPPGKHRLLVTPKGYIVQSVRGRSLKRSNTKSQRYKDLL
jgi:hypothetical protein